MSELIVVILLSLCAGAAMPFGALFAKYDLLKPSWLGSEWRHFIIAFGGGALLSAIALVLVPEGTAELHIAPAAIYFALGGLFFCCSLLTDSIASCSALESLFKGSGRTASGRLSASTCPFWYQRL